MKSHFSPVVAAAQSLYKQPRCPKSNLPHSFISFSRSYFSSFPELQFSSSPLSSQAITCEQKLQNLRFCSIFLPLYTWICNHGCFFLQFDASNGSPNRSLRFKVSGFVASGFCLSYWQVKERYNLAFSLLFGGRKMKGMERDQGLSLRLFIIRVN